MVTPTRINKEEDVCIGGFRQGRDAGAGSSFSSFSSTLPVGGVDLPGFGQASGLQERS